VTLLAALTFVGLLAGDSPGVQVIKISFDKSCEHKADMKTTAKKKDRDVVIWRVVNECADAQQLTIKPKNAIPFVGCVGDPKTFKIGSKFRIDGATATADKVEAYAICAVDWGKLGKHKFEIQIKEHKTVKTDEAIEPMEHELALDVVP
jgi:hypothetical protein